MSGVDHRAIRRVPLLVVLALVHALAIEASVRQFTPAQTKWVQSLPTGLAVVAVLLWGLQKTGAPSRPASGWTRAYLLFFAAELGFAVRLAAEFWIFGRYDVVGAIFQALAAIAVLGVMNGWWFRSDGLQKEPRSDLEPSRCHTLTL